MKRTWLLLVMLCVAMLAGGPVSALDPARTIKQYKHTRWTIDDGAPPLILSLAQGRDGYLWIGTSVGLFRFDGVTFESIPQQQHLRDRANVTRLLAAQDGSIWAGYAAGGVARYSKGALRDMGIPNPTTYVIGLAETTDGTVWVQLGRPELPLSRYRNGRWQDVGTSLGVPEGFVDDMKAAGDGSLWIVTRNGVAVLRRGGDRFEKTGTIPVGHGALSIDASGRIWLSDDIGTRVIAGGKTGQVPYPTPAAKRLMRTFFDRNGNLWGTNAADGIFRVSAPNPAGESSPASASARTEMFGQPHGLTSSNVTAMTQDR